MQIGKTLQALRLRQGRSVRDLAAVTRIPHGTLALLEADDFASLPAPLYVQGFIRAYCEALGEDSSGPLLAYQRRVMALERANAPEAMSPHPTLLDRAYEWTEDRLSLAQGAVLVVASVVFLVALIGVLRTEPAEQIAATEEAPVSTGDVLSSAAPDERP